MIQNEMIERFCHERLCLMVYPRQIEVERWKQMDE